MHESSVVAARRTGRRPALWAGLGAVAVVTGMLAAPAALAAPGSTARVAGFGRAAPISLPANAISTSKQFASLDTVSCPQAGDCTAGGSYYDKHGHAEAMIVSESRGRWRRATELPFPAGAGGFVFAFVDGISCVAPGSCVAVGYFGNNPGNEANLAAFVAVESHGKWAKPHGVALPANAITGSFAHSVLDSVSCVTARFCEAVGLYYIPTGGEAEQALAVADVNGHWQRAVEVPAPAHAPANPTDGLHSVACATPQHCMAVGAYSTTSTPFLNIEMLSATDSGGHWSRAIAIGLPASEPTSFSDLFGIACPAARHCVAAGEYQDSHSFAFRPIELTQGRRGWSRPARISAAHAGAAGIEVSGVSCGGRAVCVVAGQANEGTFPSKYRALTWIRSASGHWGIATLLSLPASAAAGNAANSGAYAVSCTGSGACTVVGAYKTKTGLTLPMAATRP